MVSKLRLLLVVIFSVGEVMGSIMEYPEYVTVVKGDPASLICRVDTGDVKWFNDGVDIDLYDEQEIFLLPGGSLFFLSSGIIETALYNCE